MICYKNYRTYLVVVDILEVMVALIMGLVIIARLALWAVLGYAILGLLVVVLALTYGCTRCHYCHQVRGMGLGKIAALIFTSGTKRGPPNPFRMGYAGRRSVSFCYCAWQGS